MWLLCICPVFLFFFWVVFVTLSVSYLALVSADKMLIVIIIVVGVDSYCSRVYDNYVRGRETNVIASVKLLIFSRKLS